MNSSGLKSGLVLLTLGLILGLLLAVVNNFTEDRIESEELRLKFEAIEDFYDINAYDREEVELGDEGSIYVLRDKDTGTIEHLVYSLSAQGYGGDIEMLVAVNKDFSVEGYTITYQNETPGVGTKIEDYDFNYNQANVVSTFDSISGATISSNAVQDIFDQVANRVQGDLGGGLDD